MSSAALNAGVQAAQPVNSTRSEPPHQRSSLRAPGVLRRQPTAADAPSTVHAPRPAAAGSVDGDLVERFTQQVTQQVEKDEAQARIDEERIRADVLKQLQQDESERKAREAAETLAREQAVEAYKGDVRQRLNTMREKSDQMRTQLLASISHELDDAEVQKFIDAQNAHELQDDFVTMMIDEYKAPSSATDTAVESTSRSDATTESEERRKGCVNANRQKSVMIQLIFKKVG